MVKISTILIIIATIFLVGSRLPRYSEDCKIWIKTITDKEFYEVYDDEMVGKLYHVKTFKIPNDSLVEYYWNGNYILNGLLKLSEDNIVKYLKERTEKEENIVKILSILSVDDDTSVFLRFEYQDTSYIETFVVETNTASIFYIFGNKYSLEDSYGIVIPLAYGENKEFRVLGMVTL